MSTPLLCAIVCEHTDAVALLVELGADVGPLIDHKKSIAPVTVKCSDAKLLEGLDLRIESRPPIFEGRADYDNNTVRSLLARGAVIDECGWWYSDGIDFLYIDMSLNTIRRDV